MNEIRCVRTDGTDERPFTLGHDGNDLSKPDSVWCWAHGRWEPLGIEFGYAGANSVDFTDLVALEVRGVNDGNIYLTAADAEYLLYSLLNAGVPLPKEFS